MKLLTVSEAAKVLRCSSRTVYRMFASQRLTPVSNGTSHTFCYEAEVLALIQPKKRQGRLPKNVHQLPSAPKAGSFRELEEALSGGGEGG